MKTAVSFALFLAAFSARAQSINVQIDPGMTGIKTEVQEERAESQVQEQSGDGYRLRYETHPQGGTVVRVLEPEGAQIDILERGTRVVSDSIPMSFQARPDTSYRFIIRAQNQAQWEKKLTARGGMTMTLWVNVPPPAVQVPPSLPPPVMGPGRMSNDDFASLKQAIAAEAFSDTKLGVLRTGADGVWFTASQVGELIDLYTFSKDKLDALGIVKGRILDRNNRYHLLGHFTFDNDKKQAQAMLH